jgi:hypothetical protein
MTSQTLKTFRECFESASIAGGKKHLLLGNGFSVGAHARFRYGALFEQAKRSKLSAHVVGLFKRYGTTNFEEILKVLDDGSWLARYYKLRVTDRQLNMVKDYRALKKAMVSAIAKTHPDVPSDVGEEKLRACLSCISSFDNVYTLNYDELLYWASVLDDQFPFEDGFGREAETPGEICIFLPTGSDSKHLYFLHGALHLFSEDGEVKKHVWKTTGIPLVANVRASIEDKRYPLVVSEGKSIDKKRRIEASSYLSYCWRKLENIQGSLFIFGHSLSIQDEHLMEAIANNTSLPRLYVSLHGDYKSKNNHEVIRRAKAVVLRRNQVLASKKTGRRIKKDSLDLQFFQSESVPMWAMVKS